MELAINSHYPVENFSLSRREGLRLFDFVDILKLLLESLVDAIYFLLNFMRRVIYNPARIFFLKVLEEQLNIFDFLALGDDIFCLQHVNAIHSLPYSIIITQNLRLLLKYILQATKTVNLNLERRKLIFACLS